MNRSTHRTILLTMALLALAGTAHAGVLDKVGGWFKGEDAGAALSVLAFGVSGLAGLAARKAGKNYDLVTRTMSEAGEFMLTLGAAAADRNVTRDELADIIRQGADVINIYRPTPVQYQTGQGNPEPPRALVR